MDPGFFQLLQVFPHPFQMFFLIFHVQICLVGRFNPFEKYARQIGSFPKIEVKINHV